MFIFLDVIFGPIGELVAGVHLRVKLTLLAQPKAEVQVFISFSVGFFDVFRMIPVSALAASYHVFLASEAVASNAMLKIDHFFGFRVDFRGLIIGSKEIVEMVIGKDLSRRGGSPIFLGSQDHVDEIPHLRLIIVHEPADLAHREPSEEKASFVVRELPLRLRSRCVFDGQGETFDRRVGSSDKRVGIFDTGFVGLSRRIATLAFLEILPVFLSDTFVTLKRHCW